jgi:antitoxin MazE
MIGSTPGISLEDIMLVSKWGNGLAVGLPTKLVEEMGLNAGDEVELTPADARRLAVRKIDRRAEFLDRLQQFNLTLRADYKFDRDEANER